MIGRLLIAFGLSVSIGLLAAGRVRDFVLPRRDVEVRS